MEGLQAGLAQSEFKLPVLVRLLLGKKRKALHGNTSVEAVVFLHSGVVRCQRTPGHPHPKSCQLVIPMAPASSGPGPPRLGSELSPASLALLSCVLVAWTQPSLTGEAGLTYNASQQQSARLNQPWAANC